MIGPGFAAAVGGKAVKRIAIAVLAAVVVVALVAALVGYEIAVSRECGVQHPWWYCARLFGR